MPKGLSPAILFGAAILFAFLAMIWDGPAQVTFGILAVAFFVGSMTYTVVEGAQSVKDTKDGVPGAIEELMGIAKSSAQFSSVDTLATKKGAVTVAWAIAPSLDMFGYEGDKLGARKAEIASKLHEALKGNPDIDPTRFQQSLGIAITHVERSGRRRTVPTIRSSASSRTRRSARRT